MGAKIAGQVINWCITLYVIRILTPEDYGLMAMAMPFIAVLLPISELAQVEILSNQRHGVHLAAWDVASLTCPLSRYRLNL